MTAAELRVRAIAWLLWLAVVAGPVMGALALIRPATAAVSAVPDAAAPAAVMGLAELAVLAHLTAAPGEADLLVTPALPALRLGGSAFDGLSGEAQASATRAAALGPTGAVAVAATPAGPDRWGVTVAVLRAGLVEGWQVTVADAADGPVVETLPAVVGLPGGGSPPVPDLPLLREPEGADPLADAVDRFLAALLTGEGELSRYLAPGADVLLPTVVAGTTELRRIAARPLDDRRVVVLAEVRLVREDGAVHLLQYPLLVAPADGRWEVTRVLPAIPATAPPRTPPRTPPATTAPDS